VPAWILVFSSVFMDFDTGREKLRSLSVYNLEARTEIGHAALASREHFVLMPVVAIVLAQAETTQVSPVRERGWAGRYPDSTQTGRLYSGQLLSTECRGSENLAFRVSGLATPRMGAVWRANCTLTWIAFCSVPNSKVKTQLRA
jgi:hypothetical protein